ncbi:MAG TPA: DUF4412 domain-containing protein [Gemmatimonadaceae bacterium]|nr:DUF4412 domain-containing protein [Gemmatimonadaceae bacterium]
MRSHPLTRSALTAFAIALLAQPARAQQFEGVIIANMSDQNATVTYSIKGEKLRTEMAMGAEMRAATIIDRAARKMILLLPGQQAYMERALDTGVVGGRGQAHTDADFSWTGTHQTIAGVPCDDAVLQERDGMRLNMCIARGITFAAGGGMMGRGVPRNNWQSRIQGGFPMRVQREGEAKPLMEVMSVERKALPDDLFTPPAGWTKMSMFGHP